MREIKFRVWYFKEKRMIDWEEMKDGTETIDIYLEKRCSDISEPMQFAGLKDKNGREIFEGDLIDDGLEIYWNKYWHAWAVKLPEETTVYSLLYKYLIEYASDDGIEIIGNIHENPELLEAK